jgi:hypothetical protein
MFTVSYSPVFSVNNSRETSDSHGGEYEDDSLTGYGAV